MTTMQGEGVRATMVTLPDISDWRAENGSEVNGRTYTLTQDRNGAWRVVECAHDASARVVLRMPKETPIVVMSAIVAGFSLAHDDGRCIGRAAGFNDGWDLGKKYATEKVTKFYEGEWQAMIDEGVIFFHPEKEKTTSEKKGKVSI